MSSIRHGIGLVSQSTYMRVRHVLSICPCTVILETNFQPVDSIERISIDNKDSLRYKDQDWILEPVRIPIPSGAKNESIDLRWPIALATNHKSCPAWSMKHRFCRSLQVNKVVWSPRMTTPISLSPSRMSSSGGSRSLRSGSYKHEYVSAREHNLTSWQHYTREVTHD